MDKTDWNAAAEELLAAERERLGPPPAAEEVRAYLRDELPEADAERVRNLLVCYPEVALNVPQVDAEGLTDEEAEEDWRTLQARIARRKQVAGLKSPSVSRVLPLAAVVVIGVATVTLLQLRWSNERERLTRRIHEPRVHGARHTLDEMGSRGASGARPYRLPAGEDDFLIAPILINHPEFPEYRIEIVDVSGSSPRVLWGKGGFRRDPREGTLEISIPRSFLPQGLYRLDVHGVVGTSEPKFLASYLVEAP